MKIRDAVEDAIRDTSSGRASDVTAKSILGVNIASDAPFQAVELRTITDFEVMLKDADSTFIYCHASEFYVTAYYQHDDRYPVGRAYFLREKGLLELARLQKRIAKRGFNPTIVNDGQMRKIVDHAGLSKRISDFRKRQSEETKLFRGLFEGRESTGAAGKAIFLNTPGCLVCGSKECFLMSSTIRAMFGVMVGFNLCQKHRYLAQEESSLIEFLASLFKQLSPIRTEPLDLRAHVEMTLQHLPQMVGCSVEKLRENTITLLRPSGVRVILRLDALDDYGYMIFNKQGEEAVRVDSANHHKVNYGPDHIHEDLLSSKTASSSFTTGAPLVDVGLLKREIRKVESEDES
ncbi:hypothetical protein [Algiphilus sp.]|uniref:hypothetical protein n=1 Tax=Algiphilus sp. TaxID=1872431 RepID=UPI003BAADCD8